MNPTLQLNLSQQLKLNPQLQQSIKLLQLSQLALQQEIQYQLDSNPLLILIDDNHYPQTDSSNIGSASETLNKPASDLDSFNHNDNLPDQPISQSFFDSDQASYRPDSATITDNHFENLMQDKVGLREHLEWQIQMSPLSREDMEIAYYVIENIDDAGFLTASPAEIAEQVAADFQHTVEPDEVSTIIHQVQQLEPLGCASNNLQEFLLLQLKNINTNVTIQQTDKITLAIKLIKHHFDSLRRHQYQDLMQRLSLTEQEINDALTLIKHLRTQPNYQYLGETTEYIKPDVLVYKLNQQWQAQLAGHSTPQLDINHQYADYLRQSKSSTDRQYLHENLQKARWFMQSIEARNDTLKRVADWIVRHQQNFFEQGESALRPMRLKDLAQDLNLHESTISRACNDKYLQSPKGIYELKYFFSNAIPSTQGGEWSSKAIKNKIKQFVNAEPSRKPLSDIKLAELLQQEGISIARRTVSKYREALNIPPASQRKLFTNS
ncbi:RNA polymerase factor sigma-54 [Kangiella sp.]|uniref:RNA polymerase factor sigma-54 n=1 Tax=Kangiella sp. TaxID=1920245 RepID=UPI0019956198|nr:RNA polymerase factor sigma-54 [Kangiella sp.]MBD3653699.1 RNA polymerase factor sigma-54 [Kangiella sp.]